MAWSSRRTRVRTSASSGRVRTKVRVSGMTSLTKRRATPRSWGMAIPRVPSAVWTRRVRTPLREPTALGVRL
jgi:hypothetical protein